jgi:hypothetical protein
MAVSTTNAIDGPYTTNGATTVFPFTFTAPTAGEVSVVLRDADGVDTTVDPDDYTVSLTNGGGGSVTFDAAPASGSSLYVVLDVDFTQDTAFEQNGPYLARAVNAVNDRAAARDQVLKRDVERAIKVPLGESPEAFIGDGQLVGKVAGKFVGVDNDPASAADSADRAAISQTAAAASAATALAKSALIETRYALIEDIAGAAIHATWTELAAVTGMADGDSAVIFEDSGSHTDPVTSGTVDNAGLYLYRDPTGWERIADASEAARQAAAAQASADDAAASATSAAASADTAAAATLAPAFDLFDRALGYGRTTLEEAVAFANNSTEIDFTADYYRDRKTISTTLDPLDLLTAVQSAVTWAPNADGSLTKFAANTPRITDLGLRIGAGTVNLVTSPDDLNAWTKAGGATVTTGQLAPDGTTTACRIIDASASLASVQRAVTVATANAAYTWSVYIKKEPATALQARIRITFTGGTSRIYDVMFQPDTGAVSVLDSTVPNVEALKDTDGNDWWRVSGTRTPPETHTGFTLAIYPAYGVAGDNAAITAWMPQVEQASSMGGPVVGTKAADSVTLALFDGADDDFIALTTTAGGRTGIVRSNLADASQVVLAPSGGDIAVNGTIDTIRAVSAAAERGRSLTQLKLLASSGGQPVTMASGSPTFTLGVANAAATLTGPFVQWDAAGKFGLLSADWISAGSAFPDAGSGKPRSVTQSADGTVYFAVDPFIEFDHTGDEFEIRLKGFLPTTYQMWVDGELSANAFPSPTSGTLTWVKVTFGSTATRRIRLEKTNGTIQVYGVQLKPGQSISAPPAYSIGGVVYGDSYTYATGADNQATGYAAQLMHELGVADYRISGSGGTGWDQENNDTTPVGVDYRDRWAADMIAAQPDLAIVVGSVNDDTKGDDPATVAARMLTSVQELRAARPGCLIHVFGPQDKYAPSAPSANHLAITAAMEAALDGAGIEGVWFHAMTGVAFTKYTDGAHPDQAGHETLKNWMYGMIADTHGLRAL